MTMGYQEASFKPLMVKDMGADERPRERALQNGIASLTDADLLALLLGGGVPGMSVMDLSKQMLAYCDNRLVQLAKMPMREMMRRFKGVGEAKAVTIAAAFELGRRLQSALEREAMGKELQVRTSADAYNYIRRRVELLENEEFWVLMLSRSNRIKGAHRISAGGVVATVVDARLVFRTAIDCLASGLILVHNHPSGSCQPSGDDDRLTRSLTEAARLLDMRVMDHLIITSTGYYSYSDEGRL